MKKFLITSSPNSQFSLFQKGFTLVELLVVIAILGILAAAILVALDPVEQIARGRDSGRKTTISQLGNAVQSYFTVQAAYPVASATWLTTLTSAGELKSAPPANTPAPTCGASAFNQNGYCYQLNGVEAVVYTLAESKTEKVRAGGGTTCASTTWIVWSTRDGGKTGVYCNATAPDGSAALGANLK